MANQKTGSLKKLQEAQYQTMLLIAIVMLSSDSFNPVKIICHAIGIETTAPLVVGFIGLAWLLLTNLDNAVYNAVKTFFSSILSIFFSSIEVTGLENIPKEGPVIFVGNHQNQFVDGILVLMTCIHKIGFLMAKSSFSKPVVGQFARLMGAIPVVRPQDSAKVGPGYMTLNEEGQLTYHPDAVKGEGSCPPSFNIADFVQVGDAIKFEGIDAPIKIGSVCQYALKESKGEDTPKINLQAHSTAPKVVVEKPTKYKIYKKVNQSEMYASVYEHLVKGESIGIFPEGGSHDRTDLLPLKAGIAVMAFGMLDEYNINIPVVPCGLNYFRGHRFRGRAVVQFGTPISISEDEFDTYTDGDKKGAFSSFLTNIENGLRATIVTAPDYETLHLLYTARRLFMPFSPNNRGDLSAYNKLDMNRRFTEGFKILRKIPSAQAKLEALKDRLQAYQDRLDELGLRDYQVPTLSLDMSTSISSFIHMFFVFLLAVPPSLLLNFPVGLAARMVGRMEQEKALKKSSVKIRALDVVMSKKIQVALVGVPVLWVFYALLLVFFTNFTTTQIVLIFLSFPLFSYVGVRAVESGMVDWKDIRPRLLRTLPAYRRKAELLPHTRRKLQKDIREFIQEHAEVLGPLYSTYKIDWKGYMDNKAKQFDELEEKVQEEQENKKEEEKEEKENKKEEKEENKKE